MTPEQRDEILEGDSFFTEEGLPFARRIWNNLLSSVEALEEEEGDPWRVAEFVSRVARCMASRKPAPEVTLSQLSPVYVHSACKECRPEQLDYLAWHRKAEELGEKGQRQRFCALCRRWRWPHELMPRRPTIHSHRGVPLKCGVTGCGNRAHNYISSQSPKGRSGNHLLTLCDHHRLELVFQLVFELRGWGSDIEISLEGQIY